MNGVLVLINFFVVPTIDFKLMFVFLILARLLICGTYWPFCALIFFKQLIRGLYAFETVCTLCCCHRLSILPPGDTPGSGIESNRKTAGDATQGANAAAVVAQ
jgi:hypothetical protein